MRAAPRPIARLALVACLGAALAPAAAARAETPASDPRATKIADQVMTALGGRDRWDKLRGIRWSFEVTVKDTMRASRRHSWDKWNGWHRVDGVNRSGQKFTFIEQLEGKAPGRAWMNAQAIQGDSLAKLMKRAKSLWINDTYWMLMPYKLRDPGVHLGYDGDTTFAGATYDRLTLSFNHVGETPGDHYWVYVNRANHRVERWDMVLQGDQPPPATYTWEGWEQHSGLWFPTAHRQDKLVIYTRNVETVTQFKPGEFKNP